MAHPRIVSVTVSTEFGDKDYGNGTASFMNMTAKYPDEGATIDQVVDNGLEMYFTAWKTLLASRCAVGTITGSEFKETLGKVSTRFEKVRNILKAGQSGE